MIELYNAECIEKMKELTLKGVKVDAIIADLPYFQVVKDAWDNQWKYFIGIEKSSEYFKIAKERLQLADIKKKLF